jgi:hypothetical protein
MFRYSGYDLPIANISIDYHAHISMHILLSHSDLMCYVVQVLGRYFLQWN